MNEDIQDIEIALIKLQQALLGETKEQWDELINGEYELRSDLDSTNRIHIRVCGEIVIDKQSATSDMIEYLVATYDNSNIRITIDASRNHGRAHIHIGIKKDKYHSASIALDDGTILNNTGNISDWKVKKIIDWVKNNRQLLEKIYRCINPWGEKASADKRRGKLPDVD
jgi:hypothetical protein